MLFHSVVNKQQREETLREFRQKENKTELHGKKNLSKCVTRGTKTPFESSEEIWFRSILKITCKCKLLLSCTQLFFLCRHTAFYFYCGRNPAVLMTAPGLSPGTNLHFPHLIIGITPNNWGNGEQWSLLLLTASICNRMPAWPPFLRGVTGRGSSCDRQLQCDWSEQRVKRSIQTLTDDNRARGAEEPLSLWLNHAGKRKSFYHQIKWACWSNGI